MSFRLISNSVDSQGTPFASARDNQPQSTRSTWNLSPGQKAIALAQINLGTQLSKSGSELKQRLKTLEAIIPPPSKSLCTKTVSPAFTPAKKQTYLAKAFKAIEDGSTADLGSALAVIGDHLTYPEFVEILKTSVTTSYSSTTLQLLEKIPHLKSSQDLLEICRSAFHSLAQLKIVLSSPRFLADEDLQLLLKLSAQNKYETAYNFLKSQHSEPHKIPSYSLACLGVRSSEISIEEFQRTLASAVSQSNIDAILELASRLKDIDNLQLFSEDEYQELLGDACRFQSHQVVYALVLSAESFCPGIDMDNLLGEAIFICLEHRQFTNLHYALLFAYEKRILEENWLADSILHNPLEQDNPADVHRNSVERQVTLLKAIKDFDFEPSQDFAKNLSALITLSRKRGYTEWHSELQDIQQKRCLINTPKSSKTGGQKIKNVTIQAEQFYQVPEPTRNPPLKIDRERAYNP